MGGQSLSLKAVGIDEVILKFLLQGLGQGTTLMTSKVVCIL